MTIQEIEKLVKMCAHYAFMEGVTNGRRCFDTADIFSRCRHKALAELLEAIKKYKERK